MKLDVPHAVYIVTGLELLLNTFLCRYGGAQGRAKSCIIWPLSEGVGGVLIWSLGSAHSDQTGHPQVPVGGGTVKAMKEPGTKGEG